jgi:hypothetical protein
MITITKLEITNDLTTLNLDIAVDNGQVVTSLSLWNEDTFKDVDNAVDLTSFLSGATNTESLTFAHTDIGTTLLSGLYFIEIKSDDAGDKDAVVSVINLNQFYGVVVALLFTVNTSCLNCNSNLQNALLLDMYMEGIGRALQVGRFQDAIIFLDKINIITVSVDCTNCFNQTITDPGTGWISVGVLDCLLDLD